MADTAANKSPKTPNNMRLLLILEEAARADVPLTPAELSEALGLPKATIYRLISTAESEGFLQRDLTGKRYSPGDRLRRLSANTLSSQRIRTERLMVMRSLSAQVGETCNLAAPGRSGMIYLDRVETHWPLRIRLPVGTQVPFHCTASGKLYLSSLRADRLSNLLKTLELNRQTEHTLTSPGNLLSEIEKTRKRGHAIDNEEFMDGMVAIAVPITDSEGRMLATLSIHAPIQRHDIESLTGQLAILKDAARSLQEMI